MENIVTYLNYFTQLIFGIDLVLTPTTLIENLSDLPANLYDLPGTLLAQPATLFSLAVWTFFAILLVRLLLVAPYRFARSLLRRLKP